MKTLLTVVVAVNAVGTSVFFYGGYVSWWSPCSFLLLSKAWKSWMLPSFMV